MNSSLIGGQNVATTGERTQSVINPATGEGIDQLGLSSAVEVVAAVEAAAAAFPTWSASKALKQRSCDALIQ